MGECLLLRLESVCPCLVEPASTSLCWFHVETCLAALPWRHKASLFSNKLVVLAGEEDEDPCYSPQKALSLALTDWLQEFLSPDHPGGREGARSLEEQLAGL